LVVRRALVVAMVVMGACGLLFLVGGTAVFELFTTDGVTLELGAKLMLIAAGFQVFDAVALVLMCSLNGAGDTRFVMVISTVTAWAILVPLGWFLSNAMHFGAAGAWWALTAQIVAVAAIYWLRWQGLFQTLPARQASPQLA
jgi:MATE family multidrug resistance protein